MGIRSWILGGLQRDWVKGTAVSAAGRIPTGWVAWANINLAPVLDRTAEIISEGNANGHVARRQLLEEVVTKLPKKKQKEFLQKLYEYPKEVARDQLTGMLNSFPETEDGKEQRKELAGKILDAFSFDFVEEWKQFGPNIKRYVQDFEKLREQYFEQVGDKWVITDEGKRSEFQEQLQGYINCVNPKNRESGPQPPLNIDWDNIPDEQRYFYENLHEVFTQSLISDEFLGTADSPGFDFDRQLEYLKYKLTYVVQAHGMHKTIAAIPDREWLYDNLYKDLNEESKELAYAESRNGVEESLFLQTFTPHIPTFGHICQLEVENATIARAKKAIIFGEEYADIVRFTGSRLADRASIILLNTAQNTDSHNGKAHESVDFTDPANDKRIAIIEAFATGIADNYPIIEIYGTDAYTHADGAGAVAAGVSRKNREDIMDLDKHTGEERQFKRLGSRVSVTQKQTKITPVNVSTNQTHAEASSIGGQSVTLYVNAASEKRYSGIIPSFERINRGFSADREERMGSRARASYDFAQFMMDCLTNSYKIDGELLTYRELIEDPERLAAYRNAGKTDPWAGTREFHDLKHCKDIMESFTAHAYSMFGKDSMDIFQILGEKLLESGKSIEFVNGLIPHAHINQYSPTALKPNDPLSIEDRTIPVVDKKGETVGEYVVAPPHITVFGPEGKEPGGHNSDNIVQTFSKGGVDAEVSVTVERSLEGPRKRYQVNAHNDMGHRIDYLLQGIYDDEKALERLREDNASRYNGTYLTVEFDVEKQAPRQEEADKTTLRYPAVYLCGEVYVYAHAKKAGENSRYKDFIPLKDFEIPERDIFAWDKEEPIREKRAEIVQIMEGDIIREKYTQFADEMREQVVAELGDDFTENALRIKVEERLEEPGVKEDIRQILIERVRTEGVLDGVGGKELQLEETIANLATLFGGEQDTDKQRRSGDFRAKLTALRQQFIPPPLAEEIITESVLALDEATLRATVRQALERRFEGWAERVGRQEGRFSDSDTQEAQVKRGERSKAEYARDQLIEQSCDLVVDRVFYRESLVENPESAKTDENSEAPLKKVKTQVDDIDTSILRSALNEVDRALEYYGVTPCP